ncbi:hypothetical protein [Pontibacter harenae]|uniref:hypothetical protein n=1 Tax=Pontibacter harenae TaxID=2894083 RepID=UPI001E518275|nr:hypothetical protein [Pontibacter harenae]MCC9168775.1 hypothetical protein [Pontibacter harenae]
MISTMPFSPPLFRICNPKALTARICNPTSKGCSFRNSETLQEKLKERIINPDNSYFRIANPKKREAM